MNQNTTVMRAGEPVSSAAHLRDLLRHRDLLLLLTQKDLKAKYKSTFLGFLWSMLNPLLLMLVYTAVFSVVVRFQMERYPVFLLAGVLPWNAFIISISTASMTIVGNGYLIRRVNFPREYLPLASVLSGLVNLCLSLLLLFVGRVAPHKGHLRLLRTLALLRSELDVPVRLFVVGGPGPHSYIDSLLLTVGRLGLEGSVTFTGAVSDGRLLAHYEAADLFLSLSEHEGFGIPLLEAMRAGLPVVACEAGAVGETLGGAGVVLETGEPAVVAEVVARLRQDEDLRRQVVERQRARALALDAVDRVGALTAALREVGEG